MTLTDKIFAALTVVAGLKRSANTIAIDVFGPRFTESDLKSLRSELSRLVKSGHVNSTVRDEYHSVRNNKFGGASSGKHRVAMYSVEPAPSVHHEAVELAKAYVNEGDSDADAVWKACEVHRDADKKVVAKAIQEWT